ncbi:MAG: ABC transporter substrate-binding protein [Bacillota bacterium]|nr:ABC transporter substrate-binding protein [Bacillota bacterium]
MRRVLALGLFVALLSGCGASPSSPSTGTSGPSGPQELTVALVADVVTFDPLDIQDIPSSDVAGNIMEHLVTWDEKGHIVPHLAERWTVSENGLTWTFYLRQGVKFHDGSPFDAHVVEWQFNRVMHDDDAPQRARKQFSDAIESMEVPDDYTIVFHLKAPNAAFMELVLLQNAGMIASRQNFEKLGPADYARHPVGTGPFIFVDWIPGQRVILKKNPDYWGNKAKLDTLIFRPISEANTQVIELETGGIQMATKVGVEDMDRLRRNPDVQVLSTPSYQIRFLRLNGTNELLSDIRVRQAINHAIDVPTVVKSLVGEMGVYNPSAVTPTASWAHPQQMPTYAYDPQKAAQLLEDAGWTLGAGNVRQKDGKPLKITFLSPNGRYFADKEIAEAVKKAFQDVGFQVDLKVMEWAAFLEDYRSGRFDIALGGWNQSSPEPSLFLDAMVMTGGRANYSKYSDREIDQWLRDALVTSNQGERAALYRKVILKVQDLAWFVPLYDENKVAAIRKEVKGYIFTPAFARLDTIYIQP